MGKLKGSTKIVIFSRPRNSCARARPYLSQSEDAKFLFESSYLLVT